jgi:hypothetical protein
MLLFVKHKANVEDVSMSICVLISRLVNRGQSTSWMLPHSETGLLLVERLLDMGSFRLGSLGSRHPSLAYMSLHMKAAESGPTMTVPGQ